MSSETSKVTSELINGGDYGETELTLGLPGESRGKKRRFSDLIDLKAINDDDCVSNQSDDTECLCSDATKPPPAKEQVAGWPPLRLCRKNVAKSSFKYVKVAVDGAPYLRKVDLDSYSGYQQLQCALENVFMGFTAVNILNEKKSTDPVNRIEYVTTYEDKDGDWMLVGDVPWTMFTETCKRIRLMRSSKTINDSRVAKDLIHWKSISGMIGRAESEIFLKVFFIN